MSNRIRIKMYKKKLICKLYSEELYNSLCNIESVRDQLEKNRIRKERKEKLIKINNIRHDKI